MDLSIIIVNYNNSPAIFSCLDSIEKDLGNSAYETIVVDNRSTDGSSRLIREKYGHCKLIENSSNLGFARAVNAGFRESCGRYLLLLNPDIGVLSHSVRKMTDFLQERPEVGLVLPKLINPDGSLQFSCRAFYDIPTLIFRRTPLGRFFPRHRVLRHHLMMDWDHGEMKEVDWALGACMMLRRQALRGKEIFDERFFLYFEDVDLCFRLKGEGWKVVYYPEAVMVHAHARQSARGLLNRARWEHFKSLIQFYWKHRRFRP